MTVTGAECPAVADGTCAFVLLELLWNDAQIAGIPGPASYGPAIRKDSANQVRPLDTFVRPNTHTHTHTRSGYNIVFSEILCNLDVV